MKSQAIESVIAFLVLLVLAPLCIFISIVIALTSRGDIIFCQERIGHRQKRFILYKFRTMKIGSEKHQDRYQSLNQGSGPTFKIRDDPRFTNIGKILAWTHLDEVPQFWNVVKGDMRLVGFRPLPENESKKFEKTYIERFNGYPGLTSTWAIEGMHDIPFEKWMQKDIEYEKRRSFLVDVYILFQTILLILDKLLMIVSLNAIGLMLVASLIVIGLVFGAFLPMSDKVQHVIVFFLFGLMGAYALDQGQRRKPLFVAFIATGVILETVQLFMPARTFDLLDMLMNVIGIVLGICVYLFLNRKRKDGP